MQLSLDFLMNANVSKDEPLILGCSGGPDSMCLLYLLNVNNYNVICTHINHNIRKTADQEEIFVKNYCAKNGIAFESIKLPKESQNEAYYRKKRYDYLKRIADKYNTKYIVTAHHGDDLIETILMRIARGSTLLGYSGFNKIYEERNYIFIKPLIFYQKKEIEIYNREKNIPYVIDESNSSDMYTRNRYRNHILPFLKKENPNINLKYLEFSQELIEANEYIDNICTNIVKHDYRNYRFNMETFLNEDNYIKKKILEKLLKIHYQDDITCVTKKHINNLLNEINKNKNFTFTLPKGKILKREYNYLLFQDNMYNISYNFQIESEVVLETGIIKKVKNSRDISNYVIRLDSSELRMPLWVRNRKNGDKIAIKNLNGTKKIKSIFIDEKISPSKRAYVPIVVDSNNEIIWIPGLRKSKFDKKINEKYDIILEYKRKEKFNEK